MLSFLLPKPTDTMPSKRLVLRAIAYCVAFPLALLILIVAVLYFWPDQDLSPQAEAMRTLPAKVPAEKNGALYAMGITAQDDPITAASAYVAAHDNAAAQRSNASTSTALLPAISSVLGSPTLTGPWLEKNGCLLAEILCLKNYQYYAPELRLLQRNGSLLLQRYAQLKTYPFFQQPLALEFDSPILDYKPIMHAARLSLMLVALDMQEPATQLSGLEHLNQEANYWRSVMAQSDYLIDKVIAVNLVVQQVRLASEIISIYPSLASAHTQLLSAITQPLNEAELSLQGPFHTEFSMLSKVLILHQKQLKNQIPMLDQLGASKMLYKPNTTINRMGIHFDKALRTHSLSAKDLSAQQALQNATQNDDTALSWLSPSTWINPLGAILATTAAPNFSDYTLRLHDLDSLLRLTEVQRLIALKSVAPADIPNFINQLGPALHDPYTQAPVTWHADTQTLSAQAHSSKAKDRPVHVVRLVNQ
jgi:hypothetical protein